MSAMICILCGTPAEAGHEKSAPHQRAAAQLAINIADGGRCPYCDPRKTRRTPCASKDHAAKVAYCRSLLVEPPR
jgi:hypothetical protein